MERGENRGDDVPTETTKQDRATRWVPARPVVATSVGGLSEVVAHQQTGLLVAPEDPAGLAESVTFLLEHPVLAIQMGQAARRRVQELFAWQQCVDAYDALYRKVATKTIDSSKAVSQASRPAHCGSALRSPLEAKH